MTTTATAIDRPFPGLMGRWLALAALIFLSGAGPPEVVRVRVPSAKVSNWFPPGSDLRVLPFDQFESLAKAAADRPPTPRGPRLLKGRHSARWEGGRLAGRSVLTVEGAAGEPAGLLPLEPWSPAPVGRGGDSGRLRVTADGRLGLKVERAGAEEVAFEWTLRARSGSDGRSFSLALPGSDLASLELDLPASMVPEAAAGPRLGPAAGAPAGRSSWRFEGARGAIDLRLNDPPGEGDRVEGPRNWLEGTTRVDLGGGPINWRADWTLDEAPGSPRTLTLALDAGLEVVDASGPRVASFRLEAEGPGSRVVIRLVGEGGGSSRLTIRGACRAPDEGSWPVPLARPVDATWTGGRTLVRVDAGRVFQSCREQAGRRVPARPSDQAEPTDLVFEPRGGAGPVADLTFRRPSADATVEVRGLLRLGDAVPRIDAALTWSVERGKLLAFAADLPPGWSPASAATTMGQAVPWHSDALGNGGTRVHLGPPPVDEGSKVVTLILTASAGSAGVTGPLDLPRVRPGPGTRVVDEVWVATLDPGLSARPISGRGLAWLDPPAPSADEVPSPWVAADLANALAWRWLADDAGGTIDRSPPGGDPSGEVGLVATIRGGRIALEWTLEVETTGRGPASVPIHIDEAVGGPIAWRSAGSGSPPLDARPMDEARRALLGFPATGTAWDLALPAPSRGPAHLVGRAEGPWGGRAAIPLLSFPGRYRSRATVAVRVEEATRLEVESAGLTPIEPAGRAEGPAAGLGTRQAVAFDVPRAGGKLTVATTEPPAGPGGLIREASLVSHASPGSGMVHRLTLEVAADSARALVLRMPEGVTIDRLRKDGQAISPTSSDGSIRLDLPAPGAGRPLCVVAIDYRTGDDPRLGPIEPRRLLPELSLACLGFTWEVIVPPPWVLAEIGGGLAMSDPRPARSTISRLLGFPAWAWEGGPPGLSAGSIEARLRELDEAAAGIAGGDSSLGDWLLKLDAGRWPVVVDRMAVRDAGRGPASRINADPGGAKGPGPVRAVLEPLGLVAEPLEGVILITGRGVVPDDGGGRRAWASALRAVPGEESDATDRFQSASRWRGESTPRSPDAFEQMEGTGERRFWRVACAGWPGPGASIELVDGRRDRAWGWSVASAVLVAGMALRNRPARPRAVAIASAGMIAAAGLAWGWPEPSTTWAGASRGLLGVLAFWLGRASLRPAPVTDAPADGSTARRRGGFAAGLPTVVVLAVAAAGAMAAPGEDAPILALLPFDGPAGPADRPDRVVLLARDGDRLERLARGDDRPTPVPACLVSASHLVRRDEPGFASVTSTFEIEVAEGGPASWSIPVGPALELSAEVDAHPTPLAVSPDGLSASVTFDGPGVHVLRFRRLVPATSTARGWARARLPIGRAAFARVSVAKGTGPSWVEVDGAAGDLTVEAGGVEGGLGPIDVLEVRWAPDDRPSPPGFEGPVEALFLWDARPIGDLIRARLVHSDPEGTSEVRVALEPGMVVRRHTIPGVASIRLEGTARRPEWVARVAPPLPKDVPIEVDFWRPAVPGVEVRRWPDIDLPSASKVSGTIGFRRPGDWSGRLDPASGGEPASEAGFVRAWGALPEDGLTLAGAARYSRAAALEVGIAPVGLRRAVRSRVVLELAQGRVAASIEGTLSDRRGRSFSLEVAIPVDLRIARVEADGLLDWRKVARDALRLQFDGSEARERRVRIEGSLLAPADSVMTEARGYSAKVPWPRWLDAESLPGTLEVRGATRFQLEPGEGVVATPTAGPAESAAPFRATYRVADPSGPSTIRWGAPPARVNVAIESGLAIGPGQLNWTAALTCEVSGGPADSLNLSLPTEWAGASTLEIEGMTHRLAAQPEGPRGESTLWKITPDSPLWGRARLILRGRRPLQPGREFAYPQVTPLSTAGRGSVGRYDLGIANGSALVLEVAGSSGLQPIDASRLRPPDGPSPQATRAYHVTGERWNLLLKVGRAGEVASAAPESRAARAAFARLSCAVGPDGATWGRAACDLEPRPGPFLGVDLPTGAEIPWASVDGTIGRAVEASPGRWLVPLGDRSPRRVVFAWHLPPGPGRRPPLALPRFEPSGHPALISVEAPGGGVIASGIERISRAGWELGNLEHLARRIVDELGTLDRSSARDREAILGDLEEFELRIRRASRIPAGVDTPAGPTQARLQAAATSIAEASQAAGLDELVQEARARVGLAPPVDDPEGPATTDGLEVVRLRRSGEPHFFRSTGAKPPRPPRLEWQTDSTARPAAQGEAWGIAGGGVALWGLVGILIGRGVRPSGRLAIGLVGLSLLALMAWEPIGVVAALALFGWGRISN